MDIDSEGPGAGRFLLMMGDTGITVAPAGGGVWLAVSSPVPWACRFLLGGERSDGKDGEGVLTRLSGGSGVSGCASPTASSLPAAVSSAGSPGTCR